MIASALVLAAGVALADPPQPYLVRTFTGDADGDRFGAAVAFLWDVDGDGVRDVLVGAPEGLVAGERRGYARVFSGSTGEEIRTHVGANEGDEFGFAVSAGVGVGKKSPGYAASAPGAATVTVFTKKGTEEWVLTSGLPAETRFGQSIAPLWIGYEPGFAVGAPLDDATGRDSGTVQVFAGEALYDSIHGGVPGARFGTAVDFGPDFGLLVGAAGSEEAFLLELGSDEPLFHAAGRALGAGPGFGGAVSVLRWKYDQLSDILSTLAVGAPGEGATHGTATIFIGPHTIAGGAANDGFGAALASTGFLHPGGENAESIAVGAPGAGLVHVFGLDLFPDPAAVERLRAIGPPGSAFGAALGAGDADGDERLDLLVGAPDEGPGTVRLYRLMEPVALTTFRPGDLLDGDLADESDVDVVTFDGLKGERVRFRVQAKEDALKLRLLLRDPAGKIVESFAIDASAKPKQSSARLKSTGTFTLEIAGAAGATGGYRVFTECLLPKKALYFETTKPFGADGTVAISFLAVAGQEISLYAEAQHAAAGPLVATLTRPDGSTVADLDSLQSGWSEPDDLVFKSVPLDQTGTWTFAVAPAVPKGTVRFSTWPVPPTSGGVVLMD